MPRTGRIQLGRIFGIRIGVNPSWFIVLFFFIFWLSGSFRDILGSDTQGYAVAVGSTLLFFASLVLHELGHALVARRLGIQIDGIDLWILGGLAKMRGAPRTPGEEFLISAAGPFVTLLVIAACVGIGVASSSIHHFVDVAALTSGVHATPALLLLSWLASINALLFVFNLVPADPLDGGQIAHALAWRLTGDRNRALRVAAQVGRAFGFLLGIGGFVMLANGLLTVGLWLLLVGMFLSQAARGALIQGQLSDRIKDVRVKDIMDRDPVTIPGAMTLLTAQEEFFLRYGWPWFAVVDEVGHFLGLLMLERVEAELHSGRPALTAAEVADDEPPLRIEEQATLEVLLGSEGLRRHGAVIAVDRDGLLRGVVTLAQVRRALTPTTGGV
jgi:Zn-dependent protease